MDDVYFKKFFASLTDTESRDIPKLKSQIDLDQPIQTYTVVVSEVRGYKIDVAASSEQDALTYAELNKTYKQYGLQVVDTHYQIFTKEDDNDEQDT